MQTIENWSQHVTPKLQIVKGVINGKVFTTPHIIFNAPNKEIICEDGTRFKLGVRLESSFKRKTNKTSDRQLSLI